MSNSGLFLVPNKKTNPKLRLFCFPYAGGNAATYLSWQRLLHPDVELVAVQPPGRANRLFEKPHNNMHSLIKELLNGFTGMLEVPFVFLGHSLGSRVAFELIRGLVQNKLNLPQYFIASGSRAPHLSTMLRPLHLLDDDAFKQELKNLEGTPIEIINNEELMSLYLPLLRSDFCLSHSYRCTSQQPLSIPVTVFSGREDVQISEADLLAWSEHFPNMDKIRYFDGGHFFIDSCRDKVIEEVNLILQSIIVSQSDTLKIMKQAIA